MNNEQIQEKLLEAVDKDSNLGPIAKMIVRRRLHNPRFVQLVKEELEADMRLEADGEIAYGNIDWSQVLQIVLLIIKLLA